MKQAAQRRPRTSFLRRASRRCGEAVVVALVALLALQFFLWWCLRHDRQFTLPEYVTEIIRQRIADAGFECRLQRVHIRPNGYLEVEGLELGAPGGDTPSFTVKRAVGTVSFPHLLRGAIVPRRVVVDGGVFYCPASVSPEGRRQVVLHDIRAVLARVGGRVRVETLQAHYGEMPVVLHGEFLPRGAFGADAISLNGGSGRVGSGVWRSLNKIAWQMLRLRESLEAVGKLSLFVDGVGDDTGAVVLSVLARGETFTLPVAATTAGGAQFTATVRFDGETFHPAREVVLTVRSAEWSAGGNTVTAGPLRVVGRFGPAWEPPVRVGVSASSVVLNGDAVGHVRGRASWEHFPRVDAALTLVRGDDYAETRGTLDWATQAATVAFSARAVPSRYLAHPKVKPLLPEALDTLSVGGRLALDGDIVFGAGGKFEQTRFDFDIGAVHFADFKIRHATGHVRLTPDKLELTGADLVAANYRAQGDFSTGFTDDAEYRFLLHGSTDPLLLNDFLGEWWRELWKDFELRPDSLPLADIEIHGHWSGYPDEFIYCAATGKNLRFRGRDFAEVELRIVETPRIIALFDMRVWEKSGLGANGTLQFRYTLPPEHLRQSVSFQFDGTLPKDTAASLAGMGLPERLAPLRTERPLKLSVTGFYHGAASPTPEREQVLVRAKTTGAISAWHLPVDGFDGTVAFDTGRLVVTVNEAGFAGGKISARSSPWSSGRPARPQRAWVDLRPDDALLQLDVELLQAWRQMFFSDLGKLSENTEKPAAASVPSPSVPSTPTTPDASRLDVRFVGGMVLPKLETLSGTGHVVMQDDMLPQLHVFGGFSRVLNSVGMGLTSFHFDRVESDFTVRDKIVYFPNVKVTGDDGIIESVGRYNMADDSLNFRAIFTVKIGDEIPLIGPVVKAINRLPRLTPVNISGTLEKPVWSLDPTPSALLRRSLDDKNGRPPEENQNRE
ncbi:MAG: AsmA-like C-terminal region-containing protein [Puniceicoccales bacterium]|jgi:hypothetical protein|nr:AsmA-like C-terminal region-containing protein [Puniceicoccales bacterium]